MFLSVMLLCQENNADLESTQHFSVVLHSNNFVKLFNILVSILDIKSKGILDGLSMYLLGRLSNHLVGRLLDSTWEDLLTGISKDMSELFHSKITA